VSDELISLVSRLDYCFEENIGPSGIPDIRLRVQAAWDRSILERITLTPSVKEETNEIVGVEADGRMRRPHRRIL
jgi:hypothetical protein